VLSSAGPTGLALLVLLKTGIMADNYLEKRYDECFGGGRTKVRRIGPTIDQLLLRSRSTRGYLKDYVVRRSELEQIAEVCTRIPSACNQQVLRLRLVTRDSGADRVLPLVRMGAALPELHLPLPGTEPEAFIVLCATVGETKLVDLDLGVAAQSMLLKAASMGLSGLIVGAFDKSALRAALQLPFDPLLVLAIGKGIEKIELVAASPDAPRAYYRRDGVHYVPKLQLPDLLV